MGNQASRKKLILLLLVMAIIAGVALFLYFRGGQGTPGLEGTPDEGPIGEFVSQEDLEKRKFQNDIILPIGELVLTHARSVYQDGELRLVIPKLELDCPVLNGTELSTLRQGVGLYKYAQIPDIYNTNTSIAGHRDLYGFEFYYLDQLTEGDYIYLIIKDIVFQYEFASSYILTDTYNWDAIRVFHDSRVTLTTCDPIGTSTNRLIVVGELVAYEDYTEDYVLSERNAV